jgi:outer membrane protein
VTLPIFSGGATQSGVRQAIATREQREAELEGTGRLVERNTRNAFQGVVTGAAQVRALKQAVLSSRTALQASETGLEVGTRTAIDVLNAQQQLYAAERNYYQSRYDYLLSVLRLKSSAGRLSAADLAEIDALLVQL